MALLTPSYIFAGTIERTNPEVLSSDRYGHRNWTMSIRDASFHVVSTQRAKCNPADSHTGVLTAMLPEWMLISFPFIPALLIPLEAPAVIYANQSIPYASLQNGSALCGRNQPFRACERAITSHEAQCSGSTAHFVILPPERTVGTGLKISETYCLVSKSLAFHDSVKLPATSCGESPTVKDLFYFIFARLPRCKQRGMRSLFSSIPYNTLSDVIFVSK